MAIANPSCLCYKLPVGVSERFKQISHLVMYCIYLMCCMLVTITPKHNLIKGAINASELTAAF